MPLPLAQFFYFAIFLKFIMMFLSIYFFIFFCFNFKLGNVFFSKLVKELFFCKFKIF